MRSIRGARTLTAGSSSYADQARCQSQAQAGRRLSKNGAGVQYYAKRAIRFDLGCLEHMTTPGCCRAREGPSDGDAEQLRTADACEMFNENDFSGTQVDISEFRWMCRCPRTPAWGCAKRTENKRNKEDRGPIEYCRGSDWLATHTKDDSAMTMTTPTTQPVLARGQSLQPSNTSSAPRRRGAAES